MVLLHPAASLKRCNKVSLLASTHLCHPYSLRRAGSSISILLFLGVTVLLEVLLSLPEAVELLKAHSGQHFHLAFYRLDGQGLYCLEADVTIHPTFSDLKWE